MRTTLLFDFDGTLLDTESTVLQAWEVEYAFHGLEIDRAYWLSTVGGDHQRRPFDLEALVGEGYDHDESRARRRATEGGLVARLPLRDGIAACLDQARDCGLRLAVVSSSPADWVVGHLTRLDLLDRFEAVVTREDAHHAKPDPELYEVALARLGVTASEAVAIEDSSNGVTAALAAGLPVVALPNPVTRGQDLSGADVVLDGSQLWERIVQRLAGPAGPRRSGDRWGPPRV